MLGILASVITAFTNIDKIEDGSYLNDHGCTNQLLGLFWIFEVIAEFIIFVIWRIKRKRR